MNGRVAFVLKGYPRLSETFIAQEIRALERRGLDIEIISLRWPTDSHVHAIHQEIAAPVRYLPEYLHHEPLRVARAWRALRGSAGYRAARAAWLRDLARDLTPNRVRRFGQALVLAHELDGRVERLHAHFLHTPASVTRYAGLITGLPWTCSAHAKDIWTIPVWEKAEKLASCQWLVTCTAIGQDHLAGLAPGQHVELVYHGIDKTRFPLNPAARSRRNGRDGEPVVIVSVGRRVEKKGYAVLLDALARLPRELDWRLVHIGGGPLGDRLKRRAAHLGLADRIAWRGALPHDQVLAQYREADLFALASRIAAGGDRDGLPNVLLEAQSQGIACVATNVAAIPELIDDGANGLLVPPDDAEALAQALNRLITEPDLRERLGAAGARVARDRFPMDRGIDALAAHGSWNRRSCVRPRRCQRGRRTRCSLGCASPSTPRSNRRPMRHHRVIGGWPAC